MGKARKPRRKSSAPPPVSPSPPETVRKPAPPSLWVLLGVIFVAAFGSTYYFLSPKPVSIYATRLPSGWIFISEDPQHPVLQTWREDRHLDELIHPGKNDLEKFSILMDWVQTTGAEGENPTPPLDWDARLILKNIRDHDLRPGPVQKSVLFAQSLLSLGVPARYVQPMNRNLTDQQFGVEAYSAELKKWIYFDGGTGNPFLNGRKQPLSAMEIKQFAHVFYLLRNNTLTIPIYVFRNAALDRPGPVDPLFFEPYRLRLETPRHVFSERDLKAPVANLSSDNKEDFSFPFDFSSALPAEVTSGDEYENLLSSGESLQVFHIQTRDSTLNSIFKKLYRNFPGHKPFGT